MILKALVKWFKPAPFQPELIDKVVIDKEYRYWRVRIFYSMYLGYVFFYLTRKSFTFAMPALMDNLGYSYSQLGILSTVLYITYGISKFISGILSDQANPRYFMAVGLILTGVFNIFFGFSNSLIMFAIFWGLNGWFQGWGWPPITKQLTYWYSKEERGRWWSLCSTSHNVGGAIIPLIAGYYAGAMGWRYCMIVPGVACILLGLFLMNRLRDVPRSLGLPPIEKYRSSSVAGSAPKDIHSDVSKTLTMRQILFDHVLNNRFVLVLALSYFFVYVVRTAVNDWTVPFLVKSKGYMQADAAVSIVWFELGGLLGMIFAGWATDKWFASRRVPFVVFCSLFLSVLLGLLWHFGGIANKWLDFWLMAAVGFCVFGPQMLVGMAAAEYVNKQAVCTANGFVSWCANFGAAVAGYPMGVLIDQGWNYYFCVLLICSALVVITLLPICWPQQKLATNIDLKLN